MKKGMDKMLGLAPKLAIMERQLQRLERINAKNPRASREAGILEAKKGIQGAESISDGAEVFGDRAASGIKDLFGALIDKFSSGSSPKEIAPAICHEPTNH